jgi:hypothetical protein
MKRLALVLLIGSVAAVLCFVLMPGSGSTGGSESSSLGVNSDSRSPGIPVRVVADPELLQMDVARREAEEKVETLQRKLAEAEAARAARVKAKKPFADPEMRKVMAAEAASGVERSAKTLLDAGLAADLQLNEEQRKALQALLVERGAIGWNQILIPMAAGELKGERLATAGRQVREAYARNAAQIRGMLGNEGYAVYEWYEKTQPDRDHVKQLSPQFARAGQDLSAEQQGQLVALLTNERAGFKFEHDFGDPAKIDYEHFHQVFSEENANRHFQETQRFNQQLVQRASSVLNPDQVKLFQEVLAAQLQRAKFTVRTTMAMMGENP